MALKEEKVSVTSGKKKASVRKENVAVSTKKPKIVRKTRTHHKVQVCRGRDSIRGKSNHGPFLENRADII